MAVARRASEQWQRQAIRLVPKTSSRSCCQSTAETEIPWPHCKCVPHQQEKYSSSIPYNRCVKLRYGQNKKYCHQDSNICLIDMHKDDNWGILSNFFLTVRVSPNRNFSLIGFFRFALVLILGVWMRAHAPRAVVHLYGESSVKTPTCTKALPVQF